MRVLVMVLSTLSLVSCAFAPDPKLLPWDRLKAGLWVGAEGVVENPSLSHVNPFVVEPVKMKPVAIKIGEKTRGRSDTGEKVEITAPLAAMAHTGDLRVLDLTVRLNEKTKFENPSREEVARFALLPGLWVKVKAYRTEDGGWVAKTVRRVTPRPKFLVEGEVTRVSENPSFVEISGVRVGLEPDTHVSLHKRGRDGTDETVGGSPLALFQQDERKAVPFTIRPRDDLFFGGQVFFKGRAQDEYDLDRSRDRDKTDLIGQVKADMLWMIAENGSFVHIEGATERDESLRDNRQNVARRTDTLTRAYAYLALSDSVRLQVGRQDYDDERDWLYNDRLDAIRFHYLGEPVQVELSVAKGRHFLERQNPGEDIYSFIALGRYFLDDHHQVSAYVIDRRDKSDNEFSPFLYGLRSWGRPHNGLRHWVELARADGVDGYQELNGYGMDVGLSYVFDTPLRPTVTAGWALGTGNHRSGGNQGPFRQSGLQDNNAKFSGNTSFRYYGEVFDPELSNLQVTTLGVGVRPNRSWSYDLFAHTYRQDELADTQVDTNLRRQPNGASRDLGWGVDLVVGYQFEKSINAELVLGRFEPGRGYDKRDPAHLLQFQIRFKF